MNCHHFCVRCFSLFMIVHWNLPVFEHFMYFTSTFFSNSYHSWCIHHQELNVSMDNDEFIFTPSYRFLFFFFFFSSPFFYFISKLFLFCLFQSFFLYSNFMILSLIFVSFAFFFYSFTFFLYHVRLSMLFFCFFSFFSTFSTFYLFVNST